MKGLVLVYAGFELCHFSAHLSGCVTFRDENDPVIKQQQELVTAEGEEAQAVHYSLNDNYTPRRR